MLRSSSFIYNMAIIVVSFVCGVAIFHFIEVEQAKRVIGLVEPRLLQQQKSDIWSVVLPIVVMITLILLLATHAFLKYAVRVVVAIRVTFFGFSSVYLLQEFTSIWLYAAWWFPFQLVYSISLLVLCEVLVPTKVKKKTFSVMPMRRLFVVLCFITVMIVTEVAVLATIFS